MTIIIILHSDRRHDLFFLQNARKTTYYLYVYNLHLYYNIINNYHIIYVSAQNSELLLSSNFFRTKSILIPQWKKKPTKYLYIVKIICNLLRILYAHARQHHFSCILISYKCPLNNFKNVLHFSMECGLQYNMFIVYVWVHTRRFLSQF
jgi:hypothetical protein